MASKKLDDHTSSCRKALPPEDADHDGVAGIEGVKGVAADSRDNSGDDDFSNVAALQRFQELTHTLRSWAMW